MQLLGPDVDVPQQDVVGDDALDEGGLVVLLLIVGLGAVEGHGDHGADELGLLVAALDEGGVVVMGTAAGQGLEGLVPIDHHRAVVGVQRGGGAFPLLPDPGQLIAGDHGALVVDDTDDPVRALLHLEYNALKYSAGHIHFLLVPMIEQGPFALSTRENSNSPFRCCGIVPIIAVLSRDFNRFFINICGKCRNDSLYRRKWASSARVRGRQAPGGRSGSRVMGPMDRRLR